MSLTRVVIDYRGSPAFTVGHHVEQFTPGRASDTLPGNSICVVRHVQAIRSAPALELNLTAFHHNDTFGGAVYVAHLGKCC